MNKPDKIFVDFNNADKEGRIRLNTKGAISDIREKNILLEHGLELFLDDGEELSILGIIEYSQDENIWVAKIDWNKLNA